MSAYFYGPALDAEVDYHMAALRRDAANHRLARLARRARRRAR